MFGYVTPFKPELKIVEFEAYKAAYCGLCKRLKENYGFTSTMGLSYDFAFFSCLALGLEEAEPIFAKKPCSTNPIKKVATLSGDPLDIVAAAHVLLACGKLEDDLADEGGADKVKARAALAVLSGANKRARDRYPTLASNIDENLASLKSAEQGDELSLDGYTEHFAKLLASIATVLSQDEMTQRVLYQIGYQTGRWIYLLDALDDLPKDKEKGRFNPLVKTGLDGEVELIKEMLRDAANAASLALTLLPLKRYRGILENILRDGLAAREKGITDERSI